MLPPFQADTDNIIPRRSHTIPKQTNPRYIILIKANPRFNKQDLHLYTVPDAGPYIAS
jgi:hypothetical protein